MKLGTRITAVIGAITLLAIAGITYYSSQQAAQVTEAATESRSASLKSFRVAHTLKSLANGYELAMNEYYSTVLEYPAYHQKTTEHQTAIQRELSMLTTLRGGDAATAQELDKAFKEMESYRQALESALSQDDKDWDSAREALFKLNVVSVRAIQQADVLAKVAGDRAMSLDTELKSQQAMQSTLAHIILILALVGLVPMLLCALRARRATA